MLLCLSWMERGFLEADGTVMRFLWDTKSVLFLFFKSYALSRKEVYIENVFELGTKSTLTSSFCSFFQVLYPSPAKPRNALWCPSPFLSRGMDSLIRNLIHTSSTKAHARSFLSKTRYQVQGETAVQ